jgi:thioesterase domain-containing protein
MDAEEEAALPQNATLQEIAACVIRKIRAIRPHGPYHLGGLCVAGLLAYEAAVQLTEAGEEVGVVVMLDALNLQEFMARPPKRLLASRLRFHWKRLTSGALQDRWGYLAERVAERAANLHLGANALWSEKLHNAALRYQPREYSGRVLFFEPVERLDIAGIEESWAGVAQPRREIQRVQGNHESVLQEPMVAELAARIRRCVEEADAPRVVEHRKLARSGSR